MALTMATMPFPMSLNTEHIVSLGLVFQVGSLYPCRSLKTIYYCEHKTSLGGSCQILETGRMLNHVQEPRVSLTQEMILTTLCIAMDNGICIILVSTAYLCFLPNAMTPVACVSITSNSFLLIFMSTAVKQCL